MTFDLQEQLIQRIAGKFHRNSDAVNAIAETLGLGRDSTYRRMRGETLLTPDEICQLAVKFNLSIDEFIFKDRDTVLFQYDVISNPIKTYEDYLKRVYQNLYDVSQIPNTKIYYASLEIPIFFYMLFPKLTTFKLYIWGRTLWDFDYLKKLKFNFDIIPRTAFVLTDQIAQLYLQLSSIDLWNVNIMDNTLNQIEYYVNSGSFENEEDALTLLDDIQELMGLMKSMAETGKKVMPKQNAEDVEATFELYHNEMVHTNNTILVTSPTFGSVFSAFDNPNFLQSYDEKIVKHTEGWINRLIQKSMPISQNAFKQRNWFFKTIDKKIEQTRKRIELMY